MGVLSAVGAIPRVLGPFVFVEPWQTGRRLEFKVMEPATSTTIGEGPCPHSQATPLLRNC